MNNKRKWFLYFKKQFLLIVIMVIFFCMTTSFANDGVLGITPEGVLPITQSDIMMRSEDITIQMLNHSDAKVTCRFDFENFGEAQTVLIGFPARLDEEVEELTPEKNITVRNFTARDKNGDIPVTLADTVPQSLLEERDDLEKYQKWYTFSVDFKENEQKTLYHTYEISFTYDSIGHVYVGYIIETGALWNGPIGHSKVTFDMGDNPMYSIESVYPNNFYRIEGNKLIWERSDYIPVYNLWVTMNEEQSGEDATEREKKKIALFNTSPEVIRQDRMTWFGSYKELLRDDPISALYIKSALRLPNGNNKPEITECRIKEHIGNDWLFEIYGTDPDGDLAGYTAEITGIERYQYSYDLGWRGELFFNEREMKFFGRGYLRVEENKPFSITFVMTDAVGNADSETLILKTDNSAENQSSGSVTAADSNTPGNEGNEESAPVSVLPDSTSGDNSTDASITNNNKGERVFHMEEETIPMLIAGFVIVLFVCLVGVIILWRKKKNNGYLLYAAQIVFLSFAFYQVVGLLTLRKTFEGGMLSENISLKIGISAVYWALSMFCMLAGLFITAKKEENKKQTE